jgi:ATP-binding cassette, subfamily C (CFTR/MRP), member 1
LTDQLDFFLFGALQILISLGTIIFVTPWFAIAVLPLGYIYIKVLNYFREVSRETKRLESISRSPVYAQFSETLGGLATIRAYGQSKRFTTEFEDRVDQNTVAYYNGKSADRWLSLRLELIGSVVAGLAAFFASNVAIQGSVSGQESNSNFASQAGLSLTYAVSLTSILNWCVRTFAALEASMNACERVLHYTENVPQEAPWTSKELEEKFAASPPSGMLDSSPSSVALSSNNGKAILLDAQWPSKGEIVLSNLRMRYRPETPLVLKGLNLTILGGERVGVVGRTGSGKVRSANFPSVFVLGVDCSCVQVFSHIFGALYRSVFLAANATPSGGASSAHRQRKVRGPHYD